MFQGLLDVIYTVKTNLRRIYRIKTIMNYVYLVLLTRYMYTTNDRQELAKYYQSLL